MEKDRQIISEIRSFNRFFTNILGLLNQHILDSAYSLTEVRILLEIDRNKECTANLLMNKLNIDRGYMSRILKRFKTDGLICKENSTSDARSLYIYLTPAGKDMLSELEEKSGNQIWELISHLTDSEREKMVESMKYIENALINRINPVNIRTYQTGDIEYIIKRHRELYKDEYGFSPEFGDYVAKYVRQFDKKHDPGRENIWIAEVEGKPVGVIAVVRIDATTAQLRWFLVEPEMRGRGLGHKLMKTVMDFCKAKEYRHICFGR